MRLQDCINFQLTVTQNAVFTYFKNQLSTYGVTPAQYALLSCLWQQDGQSPSELAKTLFLDPSSMTGLLSRLESKELIRRDYSEEDRRAVIIHITPEGKALQKDVTKTIEDANVEMMKNLSEEDQKTLHASLAVLLDTALET